MPRIATGFIDGSGDLGYTLVNKEWLIESFPQLLDQNKIPTLWTWGKNNFGTLGNNTTVNASSPVQTISGGTNWKSISISPECRAGGIKTDGTLWLWGENNYCGIGGGVPLGTHRSSPVQTLSGGTNWRTISVGQCGGVATKTDGTLWSWGSNFAGQLGKNDRNAVSCPVQVCGTGQWVMGAAGKAETNGGIKTDGTLWIWGENNQGQLGNNQEGCWSFDPSPPADSQSSPVQTVAGGTNWRFLSIGWVHAAATKQDGTLWLWGDNSSGKLGDSSTTKRSSPVQTIGSATNWRTVSAGFFGTAAIKTDGTLWTWGNFETQAQSPSFVNQSSPVQTVSGGSNWLRVCNGRCVTAAIKTDGTLWFWGANHCGQFGTNSTSAFPNGVNSPVQTVVGGSNWRAAQTNGYFSIAIRDFDAD